MMKRVWGIACGLGVVVAAAPASADFKPFSDVSKGYEKVVSTADGKNSLYGVYYNKEKEQLLAELPRGWNKQKYYIAVTQASGGVFAGLQGPTRYVYWKRYDDRMAMIRPEITTRSDGEPESKSSVERLFTDQVLLDVPIVAMGPSNQPVIDLDELLIGRASEFVGGSGAGLNSRLATIVSAKAFPENIEITVEAPTRSGSLVQFHYSISSIPEKTGYKPREADERVGYFTTVYRDLGQYDNDEKWVRYINRWHLEKRDPKLRLSPPKEPVIFYLEHTVPVRYRRWIRDGVLQWNDAFRKIGLDGAIQVHYQDKTTGAHMEKDPEDVRFNFIRWLNNDISTAIGPSRPHPLTGQLLDADVVLTDGWIRAYWGWYHEQAPELAVESLSAETLTWLEAYPQWDPRLELASPEQRAHILAERAARKARTAAGEVPPPPPTDPAVSTTPEYAAISEWVGGDDHLCLAAHGLASHMAMSRMNLEALDLMAADSNGDALEGDTLDGIPEWFVGPLLSMLTAHEVGHTLGLRHNFKASSIYTMEQINSEEWKGTKPFAGSVMDYLPPNFNLEAGEVQGDFAMINIGPYDMWAIEYGYTFDDPKKVLERVAEPELAYLTDDDTRGPDPFARRYDFAADPLEYGENIMRIVNQHRERLLEKFVEDGESWSKARDGYMMTLGQQLRAVSMMANWVGGSYVHRDRKGDPDGRAPVESVAADDQRAALEFVITNALHDDAFGLTPEMLAHMTVDKWSDRSPGDRGDPTWPVHDRIEGIQIAALTMILNPTTLKRMHDNEYRTPGEDDALTLPDLLQALVDEVYREFETDLDGATFTNREPMISSLRRGLQANMTERLIVLSDNRAGMPHAIRTLSTMHLRRLSSQLEGLLKKRKSGQLDGYTIAHLEDLSDRIDKTLERIYTSEL